MKHNILHSFKENQNFSSLPMFSGERMVEYSKDYQSHTVGNFMKLLNNHFKIPTNITQAIFEGIIQSY